MVSWCLVIIWAVYLRKCELWLTSFWCLEQSQPFLLSQVRIPWCAIELCSCYQLLLWWNDDEASLSLFSTETSFFMKLLRTWYLQDLYNPVSFGWNRQKYSKVIIDEKGVKEGQQKQTSQILKNHQRRRWWCHCRVSQRTRNGHLWFVSVFLPSLKPQQWTVQLVWEPLTRKPTNTLLSSTDAAEKGKITARADFPKPTGTEMQTFTTLNLDNLCISTDWGVFCSSCPPACCCSHIAVSAWAMPCKATSGMCLRAVVTPLAPV